MKKLFLAIMILTMLAVLFGCTAEKPELPEEPQVTEEPVGTDEPAVTDEPDIEYADGAEESLYAGVLDFDSYEGDRYFAVAFLGYVDRMEFRHAYVEGIFGELGDVAIEQVGHIDYEGDEWYLVVPRYKEDVNIVNLDTGEVHTIYNGEAFTVKCNLSDIHPNLDINTAVSYGAYQFSPQMGGDGKVITNTDVWDITDYSVLDENGYIQGEE